MRVKLQSFFIGFLLTSMVLLPMAGIFVAWSGRSGGSVEAADSQPDIRVEPGAQNSMTLLLAAAGEKPDLVLLRLDCPRRLISIAVIPRQTVVRTQNGSATLEQAYAAAGPARAAVLLGETLGAAPPAYLAAAPEVYDALLGEQPVRVNLNSYLSAEQRRQLGEEHEVVEWTAAEAAERLRQDGQDPALTAALTVAVWESALRQQSSQLPAVVPRIKNRSSRLLTNLTALDLAKLQTTLDYLCAREPRVEYQVLPGQFRDNRYELDDQSIQAAAQLLDSAPKQDFTAEQEQ